MIRKRSARALAGGLIVALLLISASAAYAAVSGSFSGNTNQKQSISMRVGGGHVTKLQFHVKDTCPSGHVYMIHDFNFPSIKINKFHKFDAKFVSTTTKAQVEITGTVFKKQIKGKLAEVRFIKSEHHNCAGATRYTAHKQ
ncbi:MAG TPA: hypothetical protein VGF93_09065 [Solirubrobacteraceae bacterium]|jgi:hypothetical protein